jgi:hypothetical protein
VPVESVLGSIAEIVPVKTSRGSVSSSMDAPSGMSEVVIASLLER